MLLSHPYAKHKSHSIETSVEKHEKAWWKVRGGLLAAAADLTNQRENLSGKGYQGLLGPTGARGCGVRHKKNLGPTELLAGANTWSQIRGSP